jgi:Holliday junction DNA helicase RuvA
MFAHLNGVVTRIDGNAVILDVGGVGYRVAVPVSALVQLPAIGNKTLLHIHTYIRPEEISLYGFVSTDDQRIFELLIGVSGIGPKVALSILSAMDADSLARSVASEDTKTLVRIPGLGMKTAQRLILELKDKLTVYVLERRADAQLARQSRTREPDMLDDAVEALVNLGYNRNDARKAAERAVKDLGEKADVPGVLRAALNTLTGM